MLSLKTTFESRMKGREFIFEDFVMHLEASKGSFKTYL